MLVDLIVDLIKALFFLILELLTDALQLIYSLLVESDDLDLWQNVQVEHTPLLPLSLRVHCADFDDFHTNLLCFPVRHLHSAVLLLSLHGLNAVEAHHLVLYFDLLVQIVDSEDLLQVRVLEGLVEDIAHDIVRAQVVLIRLLLAVRQRGPSVALGVASHAFVAVEHCLVIRNHARRRCLELLLELKLLANVPSLTFRCLFLR